MLLFELVQKQKKSIYINLWLKKQDSMMYFTLLGKHLVIMLAICEQVNQLFEHLCENKMQSGKHEL